MQCGVAAADFTPEPGPVLQGHSSTNPSHAVLFPLEARASVFEEDGERAAIVSLDVIGVTLETTRRIRRQASEACGISPEGILIACSHTHCAPAALPALGMTPPEGFVESVEAAAVGCVVEAANGLEPVRLAVGCGSAHFNISRRPLPNEAGMTLNYGGIVDRRARVLLVEREDGSPMAVLFHYSCHPTAKSGSEGEISPDYPGVARRVIEDRLGCKALYLAGCFGNVRPAVVNEKGGFGSATPEQLEALGGELGNEVARVAESLRATQRSGMGFRCQELDIPFGETDPREKLEEMAADTESDRGRLLTGPWARKVLEMIDTNSVPEAKHTEMQLVRVGPLACVSIPGEPVQEIGHAIEKRLRGKLDVDDIWPVGYGNEDVGYLCTPRHHQEGGYEPTAYPYYGEPARFEGEERAIVETAEALAAG